MNLVKIMYYEEVFQQEWYLPLFVTTTRIYLKTKCY